VGATKAAIRDRYDVIVIGAGPAGLNAALHALLASTRPSLLLIDKQVPWEKPIACAEAVGRLGFHEAIPVDNRWIRFNVNSAAFHSPDGTTVTYTDSNRGGYIINRAAMQQDLAARCINLGAEMLYDARVTGISPHAGNGNRVLELSDGRTVAGAVVVDASGPLSSFGKNEPIAWKHDDLEPGYFAVVKCDHFASDTVHIHVGRDLAPGGYAWIFPRDHGLVNAGVLVGRRYSGKVEIRRLLRGFIEKNCPGAPVLQWFAGTIPCGYRRHTLAVRGLIKAGDAAGAINPISRAGIVEALMCGGSAGDAAVEMLGAETERQTAKICDRYEAAWYEKRGKRHMKLAKVKGSLEKVPDADYDRAAYTLSGLPREKLTMARIFGASVGRFPRLVWALRHLM
jgi:geranylgeranyl reductase family protein